MKISKLLFAVNILIISFFLYTSIIFADETCGPNLTWSIKDGTLTISGTGEMTSCRYDNAPWKNKREQIKKVVIEEGVTSIGDSAFYWCKKLTSIQLPDTLTFIDKNAFQGCEELISISIPKNITAIKEWTFYGCEKLSSIVLPDGLISIDSLAFCFCNNLLEISIPSSVSRISEDRVFNGCLCLSKINVADSNEYYTSDDGVLFNKDKSKLLYYPAGKILNSYSVPETVISINDYAFFCNKELVNLIIPENVVSIGNNSFGGCENLRNIQFNEGLQSIGDGAFFRCKSLSEITIPASIIYLGNDLFESCYNLTNIFVTDNSDSQFKSIDGVLFSSDGKILIAYPCGKNQFSYTVPDGVTTIGDYAFIGDIKIVNITFPEGLTIIGKSAFNDCDGILSLELPDTLIAIKENAFSSCEALTNIVIPESISVIENNAFSWCKNLVDVTVLNENTSFYEYGVFDFCNKGLVLKGYTGSTTEAHAKKNKYNFAALDSKETEGNSASTEDIWICPHCESEMEGGNFCMECGTARPVNQVCQNCGYEAKEGIVFKFCPECGAKTESDSEDNERKDIDNIMQDEILSTTIEYTQNGIMIKPLVQNYKAKNNTFLYADCSMESLLLQTIVKDTKLHGTGISENGWAKVNCNGETGYVPLDYLEFVNENLQTTNTTNTNSETDLSEEYLYTEGDVKITPKDSIYITNTDVNIREDCSPDAPIIRGVFEGTELHGTGITENGWIKINYEGITGYVSPDYVVLLDENPTTDNLNASDNYEYSPSGVKITPVESLYKASTDINIREDCNFDSSLITGLFAGTELHGTGITENGWIRIEYKERTGYVFQDYLEPVAENQEDK